MKREKKITIIRGGKGTGKTLLALKRSSFLLNKYSAYNDDNLLFITRNNTLKAYAQKLKREINLNSEITLFTLLNKSEDMVSLKELKDRYIKEFEDKVLIKDEEKKRNIFKIALVNVKSIYKKAKILDESYRDFIFEEFRFIRMQGFLDKEEYLNSKRFRNTPYEEKLKKFVMRRNSLARKALYDLFLEYDNLLLKEGYIEEEGQSLLVLRNIRRENIGDVKRYTHIVCDDMDNLSSCEIKIIGALLKNKPTSTLTFTSREEKNKGAYTFLGKGRGYTSVCSLVNDINSGETLKDKKIKLAHVRLKENHRNPQSVIDFTNDLDKNRSNEISSSEVSIGEKIIHRNFKSVEEEYSFVARLVGDKLLNNYNKEEITILSRRITSLKSMKKYLKAQGINSSFKPYEKCVTLSTIKEYTGCENKVVIILDLDENNYYEEFHREELITGIRASKETVYLTSSNNPCKFLDEVNISLFKNDDRNNNLKSMDKYKYIDFNKKREYEFYRENYSSKDIIVIEQDESITLKDKEIKKVPLYSDIAAGNPIFINEAEGEELYLPKDIVKKEKDTFALKVNGDSMINIGIDDGDYVLIERTTFVDNMQIAAVAVGDEATLKRIKRNGHSITLISENDNYKPMMLHTRDVRILGKAIGGIIKEY